MKKTYVGVLTEFDENGKKIPMKIYFNNTVYNIDRVLDMKKSVSLKVGGIGERYTIRICGKETFLFFENGKWFVEEK